MPWQKMPVVAARQKTDAGWSKGQKSDASHASQ